MVNTLVSGFYKSYIAPVVEKLNKDGVIDLKLWIYGDSQASECIHFDNKVWWWDIVFGSWFNTSTALNDEQQEYLTSKFHLFEQQIVREKLFELDTAYEIRNVIFKFIYYFKHQIENYEIQLILLSDVPHGAYDLILYHVAKMMEVRVLFAMPSFWPDMTFIYEDLNEIGNFVLEDGKVDVEKKYEKDLQYMKMPTKKDKIFDEGRKVLNFKRYVCQKAGNIRENFVLYGDIRKYCLVHIWRAIKRSVEKKIFLKNYNQHFCGVICEKDKFVYFPLHLQPEMTTDTLGGEYYDQLLAIEKLRGIIPDDWKIYVKENPKQKSYMRGKYFYDRLLAIPNVNFISKEVDTYELMKKCQFVATVVGTAGWEAISGGKPVLVFGNAWYKHFSGVTVYREGVTVDDIMQRVDHSLIERQVFALQKSAYTFWTNSYAKSLSSISEEENEMNMYCAMRNRIEQVWMQN